MVQQIVVQLGDFCHGHNGYERACIISVSYTHLDVYKRQGHGLVLQVAYCPDVSLTSMAVFDLASDSGEFSNSKAKLTLGFTGPSDLQCLMNPITACRCVNPRVANLWYYKDWILLN